MPLPEDAKTPWPPKAMKSILRDMQEADAWFSGDVDRLRNFYGTNAAGATSHLPGFGDGGAPGKVRFWPRRAFDKTPNRTQVHVPIAADIASTSADLLFSEQLRFPIPGAADNGNRGAKVTRAT